MPIAAARQGEADGPLPPDSLLRRCLVLRGEVRSCGDGRAPHSYSPAFIFAHCRHGHAESKAAAMPNERGGTPLKKGCRFGLQPAEKLFQIRLDGFRKQDIPHALHRPFQAVKHVQAGPESSLRMRRKASLLPISRSSSGVCTPMSARFFSSTFPTFGSSLNLPMVFSSRFFLPADAPCRFFLLD